jgi:uncharacterized protein YceH (UPF0502 family)
MACPFSPPRDIAASVGDVLCLPVDLTAPEIRVLGCLLEKQRTTPEAYPLSLNALRLACNQSTNRDPVVEYDEATIRDALHRLSRRRWARLASGQGSRAPKYRHLLDEALPLPADEMALLCVLMLRGAQTPGELKQRTERLHPLADLDAVHAGLDRLIARELAVRLDRRPGQKEERYTHRLGEDADEASVAVAAASPAAAAASGAPPAAPTFAAGPATAEPQEPAAPDRGVVALEQDVATLRAELAELRSAVDAIRAALDALRADLGA